MKPAGPIYGWCTTDQHDDCFKTSPIAKSCACNCHTEEGMALRALEKAAAAEALAALEELEEPEITETE